MITFSLNFDKLAGNKSRSSQEKQIREVVGTHLAFPGSDKLKMDVTVKDNGSSAISFTGPEDLIAEAKRIWSESVKPQADKLRKAAARASQPIQKAAKAAAPKRKPARAKAKVKKAPRKKR